jgi:hypothetical protein
MLEAIGAYQKAEIAKWWPIIKAAGIQGGMSSLAAPHLRKNALEFRSSLRCVRQQPRRVKRAR